MAKQKKDAKKNPFLKKMKEKSGKNKMYDVKDSTKVTKKKGKY